MTSLLSSTPSEMLSDVLVSLKAELSWRELRNRLKRYKPYPKQRTFHAAGLTHRERLLRAGNQLGKTLAGAAEGAMHLTGRYPDWWDGRRWDRPTLAWAAGVTSETTRDNVQRWLMGRPGEFGTGMIPADAIVSHALARGSVADLLDTVQVQHASGGISHLGLKYYAQGREKWQGPSLDWLWLDEEPPEDIYTEGLTRTNATGGMVWITFTPLLGMSSVVKRFLLDKSPDRHDTNMVIEEAEHIAPEERERIIASYPIHERDARTRGIPILGSGRVFPVAEDQIREGAIAIPDHWVRICGLDIGWDHPTAASWLAWDRDSDVLHVYDCYRLREATPVVHAAAIKARGIWIPLAWPHDALQKDKGSGEQIAKQYREQGCNTLPTRATFEDGTSGVEAGLMEMLDRMQTGRLKVAAHLEDWWEEYRLYHRKDGLVVKEGDDLMSATRYAVMMKRSAVVNKPKLDKIKYSNKGIV